MTDTVERLRWIADACGERAMNPYWWPISTAGADANGIGAVVAEAADEIERLTQYCAELTEAVRAEREACARIADDRAHALRGTWQAYEGKIIAHSIRSRWREEQKR